MDKVYVLDTNVILRDYTAIYAFGKSHVILPSTVLEEIDTKKERSDGVGLNARAFSREVDKLRSGGTLYKTGVVLPNGGVLRAEHVPPESYVYNVFMSKSNDNAILATAFALLSRLEDVEVVVVSLDVNVRLKADSVGLVAQGYEKDSVLSSPDEKYKGCKNLDVGSETIDSFYSDGSVPALAHENEFITLRNGSQSAVGRVRGGELKPLYHSKNNVWGLSPRNLEQKLALDLLLDPDISLVTITGKAGTGKTLLALAAALSQTLDGSIYRKILVARPVIPMGKDIGYLPGDMNEKLRPWMQPIYDNLEQLFETKKDGDIEKILAGMSRELQVEALTYIRGRSIPRQFLIIDEAQNLTKHEAKTILTRAGEGTKVVMIGDPEQIDNPFLDQVSNGLTYVAETMKGHREVGHIHLEKGERSSLAKLCADLL